MGVPQIIGGPRNTAFLTSSNSEIYKEKDLWIRFLTGTIKKTKTKKRVSNCYRALQISINHLCKETNYKFLNIIQTDASLLWKKGKRKKNTSTAMEKVAAWLFKTSRRNEPNTKILVPSHGWHTIRSWHGWHPHTHWGWGLESHTQAPYGWSRQSKWKQLGIHVLQSYPETNYYRRNIITTIKTALPLF